MSKTLTITKVQPVDFSKAESPYFDDEIIVFSVNDILSVCETTEDVFNQFIREMSAIPDKVVAPIKMPGEKSTEKYYAQADLRRFQRWLGRRQAEGIQAKPEEKNSAEQKTMSVKELAEFCGKEARTVQRWVKKAADKMSLRNDKMSLCKGHETRFTIDEVEAILNVSSLSKDAVAILMQNARSQSESISQTKDSDYVTRGELKSFMDSFITETVTKLIPAVASETTKQLMPTLIQALKSPQLEIVQDYFTIRGYANKMGERITLSEASELGKKAKKYSDENGFTVRRVEDESFGYVNSYHIDVLKAVFALQYSL